MTAAFPKTFSTYKLGAHTLKNLILMAPLTRQSAEDDGTPTDEMAAYKLADEPFPGYFGIYYQANQPSKHEK